MRACRRGLRLRHPRSRSTPDRGVEGDDAVILRHTVHQSEGEIPRVAAGPVDQDEVGACPCTWAWTLTPCTPMKLAGGGKGRLGREFALGGAAVGQQGAAADGGGGKDQG